MERVQQWAQLHRGAGQSLEQLRAWFTLGKRVPEVLQLEVTDCGAACLAMILRYHGYQTTVAEIRGRCGIGRDGLNALALIKTAQQYGLRARGLSLTPADLKFVTLPAILHWQFNHFMVVERWSPTTVHLIDPAHGRMRLSADEFAEGFTGVVLTLEPGVHFKKERAQRRLSMWHYVGLMFSSRTLVVQVLFASLLLQVLGLGMPLLVKGLIDQALPSGPSNVVVFLGLSMAVLLASQLVASL